MKKIALLLICVVFSFVIVAAENAAPAQKPAEKRALQWSKKPRFYSTWVAANEYCANLEEDGHKDWRLPTIDDWRSAVEKCPETATGGKCAISDKDGKLSMDSYNKQDCRGCRKGKIDLPGNGWFWSSSQRPDTDHYWVISFKNTRISEAKMNVPYNVYCVR
ncbi:DUF1566 domain-containing protein [bacterium]|nr:DUF1566 domain-containing protein [bacterium]